MRRPWQFSVGFAFTLSLAGCGSRSALASPALATSDSGLDAPPPPPDERPDRFVRPPDVPAPPPDVFVPDVPTDLVPVEPCDLSFPIEEEISPSPSCVVLGRVGTWCGKVSVYTRPDGSWTVEEGCQLGCDTEQEVCRRHFPGFQRVERVTRSRVCKPFMTQGCVDLYPHVGVNEFVCCGGP